MTEERRHAVPQIPPTYKVIPPEDKHWSRVPILRSESSDTSLSAGEYGDNDTFGDPIGSDQRWDGDE